MLDRFENTINYRISLSSVNQFLSYTCDKIFVTDIQTDGQIYSKNSQIVFRTFQNMQIYQNL